MYAITSLYPSDNHYEIKNQLVAISSWVSAGFKVVSCNIGKEIDLLHEIFCDVLFIEAKRSGLHEFGKPYIYIYDLIKVVADMYNGVFCIFNSDIRLRNVNDKMLEKIEIEADNKLLFLHRYDIENEEAKDGEYYFSGMDAFFLHTQSSQFFNDEGFAMGMPEWDHWMVYSAIKAGMNACEIKDPIAFHLKHPQRWKAEQSTSLIKFNHDSYYSLVNSVLSSIEGVVIEPVEGFGNSTVWAHEDVYVDTVAVQLLEKQALHNRFKSIKSKIGLGYWKDGKFFRVSNLNGSMKEFYANALVIETDCGIHENMTGGIIAAYVDFEKTEIKKQLHDKKFILYPAGKAARMMLDCLVAVGLHPLGFADKNAHLLTESINEYKVFSKEELLKLDYQYILIASNLYSEEIVAELVSCEVPLKKIIVI